MVHVHVATVVVHISWLCSLKAAPSLCFADSEISASDTI